MRKGKVLQRMIAALLSAVLITGMVSSAVPMTVLAQEPGEAQESVSGNSAETAEGDITSEDGTEQKPAEGSESEDQEETGAQGPEENAPGQPDSGQETPDAGAAEDKGQETPVPGMAGETEPGTVSGNDAAPEAVAEPQRVMMAAPAPQAENIASGEGWVLDASGVLTISSDTGMTGWNDNRSTYKDQVKSAEIQDGVRSIGSNAFQECKSLTSITMPEGVTSIGNFAFFSCSSLTNVTIPEGVTNIGEAAFDGCSRLTSITIPEGVTSIGDSAFARCGSLTNITIQGETPPTLGDSVFGYSEDTWCCFVKNGTQGIHVPEGKSQAYKEAWTAWAAYIADDMPTPPAGEHKHNEVTFTAWTATDSLPTNEGNYYLTENVTLSAEWNVPDGTTNLCLNGKTISVSEAGKCYVIRIAASSTLNLYDCQNAGNITTGGESASVNNAGTFCMYGGKISGNVRVSYGGGVFSTGTFSMYGGEISGNSALFLGGGVYVADGTFKMYGGKIVGNTNNEGGGITINNGRFIVGGDAVISGNTYNGAENNVYLKEGQTIELDGSTPLSGSANIGVTTDAAPTAGNPVNITGTNSADYSQYFHSDNADYVIKNGDNNEVQLAVKASPDTQPPTGTIKVESNSWTQFLNTVTFKLFFREAKQVTITAHDEDSGVDEIYYYLSRAVLEPGEVEQLEADKWTEGSSFSIASDRRCIIYAKITDKAGNVTYLSSDGLIFDATPPVISGVTNGETYSEPQTVTVTDAMFDVERVTVNGTEVTLTDDQFTLGIADDRCHG